MTGSATVGVPAISEAGSPANADGRTYIPRGALDAADDDWYRGLAL
ncbi:hypothetical protein AB0O64_26000 [Streptomyces sp. NPDC088341]